MWKKNDRDDAREVGSDARLPLVLVAKKNWEKTVNRCLPNNDSANRSP